MPLRHLALAVICPGCDRAVAGDGAKAQAARRRPLGSRDRRFEAADKQTPPPKDAVLFVGSSSIRLWDLKKSFPDLVAINRGFGGSQMSDAARHARRLINVYKPRLIVLYEGDNDLNARRGRRSKSPPISTRC